jgi:hypothetical protein
MASRDWKGLSDLNVGVQHAMLLLCLTRRHQQPVYLAQRILIKEKALYYIFTNRCVY